MPPSLFFSLYTCINPHKWSTNNITNQLLKMIFTICSDYLVKLGFHFSVFSGYNVYLCHYTYQCILKYHIVNYLNKGNILVPDTYQASMNIHLLNEWCSQYFGFALPKKSQESNVMNLTGEKNAKRI